MPIRINGKKPIMHTPLKQPDTTIVLPCIREGVKATPTLLGCVERLIYSDHDVSDTRKFLEFVSQVYMGSLGKRPIKDLFLQPKKWVTCLTNIGIVNLVEISHFGRENYVNNCVKQLMAVLHGGFLWLEEPISIDVDLITFIIGLPSNDESPMQYLDDKTK
jgi:hypothetical protein